MDTVTNLFFGASNDTMSQDIDILPMPTNPFDDVTIVPLADWSTTVTPMRNMPKSMGHLTWYLFNLNQARQAVNKALNRRNRSIHHEDF